ncbi:MAG: hypothetical protein Q9228_000290 [Teloschistes exilis]
MIFLTSVLNASTNWILLRHVYSALKSHSSPSTELVGGTAVLFISWLHGSDFWRDGARKLGFNFPENGKITFIDALHLGHGLREDGVKEVEDVLLKKIKEFETSNNRVLLVLDGIDFLLAGTEARLDEILVSASNPAVRVLSLTGCVQRLTVDNSEGHLVLWQAPQQNPYFVQTLRFVINGRPPSPLLVAIDQLHRCRESSPEADLTLPCQVVVRSTSKNIPARHAAILLLRSVNVRKDCLETMKRDWVHMLT